MTTNSRWILFAALLCIPVAATAQPSPRTSPHALAPTPAAPEFPGSAVDDDSMWFDDDMLAFDLGDEYYADADEMSGADDEGHGESGGERRVIVRSIRRGPGMESGMGHGLGEGMGMPRGRGGAMLHRGMGGAMRMRLAHLDLTTAQREKLRDLHEVQARKSVQRRADLQLARMDLHKLMRADKPEAGAVNTQIDRVAKLRADAMKATFDTQMQARAVLTPEQWQQLHSPPPGPGGMRHERMDAPDGAPKR